MFTTHLNIEHGGGSGRAAGQHAGAKREAVSRLSDIEEGELLPSNRRLLVAQRHADHDLACINARGVKDKYGTATLTGERDEGWGT